MMGNEDIGHERDLIAELIRASGRRSEPPPAAYSQVRAAALAAMRSKTLAMRQRRRRWVALAAAAALAAVAVLLPWRMPLAPATQVATVERAIGAVEVADGDAWRPLAAAGEALVAGARLRTLAGGRAGLQLADGTSLRLAPGTTLTLEATERLYLAGGTAYVDTGLQGSGLELATPMGTARDIGTQFELQLSGRALRLRVREGAVDVDHASGQFRSAAGEQLTIDPLGGVTRREFAPDDPAWRWAEALAPAPDVDGRPASVLLEWAARETGRRLAYASDELERRARAVILHGSVQHLAPLEALDAMLATTDLAYVLRGSTIEVRERTGP